MKKMMKNEKGFTLIELIIVIAILAIIAAVAIPNILGAVDNSRKATDVANAKIILNAAAQVNAKKADLVPTNITDLSGTPGSGSYFEALVIELNNAVPTPKYVAGTKTKGASAFALTVASNGTMKVMTKGATTDVEVAPTPDDEYLQK